MAHFREYSDKEPPKRGTARKIYDAFKAHGYAVERLSYNANCWGQAPDQGWGTWSCEIHDGKGGLESWCGWDAESGRAYLQGSWARRSTCSCCLSGGRWR